MGPGGFFSGLRNIADILGRTDFDFENFCFLDFVGSQIFGPLDFRAQGPTDFNSPGLMIWTRIRLKAFLVQLAGAGPTPSDPSGEVGPAQKFWSSSAM